jgi:hypothetical protein
MQFSHNRWCDRYDMAVVRKGPQLSDYFFVAIILHFFLSIYECLGLYKGGACLGVTGDPLDTARGHGLLVSRRHTTFKYPIGQILSMTSTTTQQQQGIEDNLGRLQQEILKRIASSDQRFTVNQLATILNKGHTTIFKSTDLLIRQNYLTFDQEYERGRKWLKLTDLGAFMAIAYYSETMPYTTVYRNHRYLQMPKLFTKLAACTFDDRSKSELIIFEFATRILSHRPPLVVRSEGTIDLSEQGEVSHHLAAIIRDTIWAFLSREDNNNPKEINYRQVNDLLTTARNIFDNSVKRIRAKPNTYQRPIIRGMQKKKKVDDVSPIADEDLLKTTNEPTGVAA